MKTAEDIISIIEMHKTDALCELDNLFEDSQEPLTPTQKRDITLNIATQQYKVAILNQILKEIAQPGDKFTVHVSTSRTERE